MGDPGTTSPAAQGSVVETEATMGAPTRVDKGEPQRLTGDECTVVVNFYGEWSMGSAFNDCLCARWYTQP